MINKLKNLTLEKMNKNLLLIALLALAYRRGSYVVSFPNPFEIIFVILFIVNLIYLIKDKKIGEFIVSIPKKIWIAIFCLLGSIFLGWFVAIFIYDIPATLNNILELGGFGIGIGIFLLIIFYTKNDDLFVKKYLYALLLPVVFIIFILFPSIAYYLGLARESTFLGFTSNPNIISKILLIPAIFFITYSLFNYKNIWIKIGHIVTSSALVALIFWVLSRGALVSVILGSIFVWIIFSLHQFNWKKFIYNGSTIFLIFIIGFCFTPYVAKQQLISKILNPDNSNFIYNIKKNQPVYSIYKKFTSSKTDHIIINSSKETRFEFWPFYLEEIKHNMLGYGPNTHMNIKYRDGTYFNIGPHNTYIEILLWGGLVGLFSFLYILFFAFKNLKIKLQSNFDSRTLALMGILFTLAIAIFFNDSLQFYWFWVILGLSLNNGKTTN